MSRRVRRVEALSTLEALITEEVTAVAGNLWVSRRESPRLDALVRRAEAAIRAEGGRGARVRVSALVPRAVSMVVSAWEAVDPPLPGLDGALLSKEEIKEVLARDSEAGALLARVAERVRAVGATAAALDDAVILALREAIGALDLSEGLETALPAARRVSARVGDSGRRGVPAAVLAGFDWYYQAESADWASCGLWTLSLAGVDVYLLYTSSDGDDAWLECYGLDGTPAASARFYGGKLLRWDEFFGRARLSTALLQIGGYTWEEGLSEEDNRVAHGQPGLAWTGELTVDAGSIEPAGSSLGTITLSATMTDEQRELVFAALDLLWTRALRYRVDRGAALSLGGRRGVGTLYVGTFVRSTDGKAYETARWRDIDDASFVLYLRREALGLRLVVEQFDN